MKTRKLQPGADADKNMNTAVRTGWLSVGVNVLLFAVKLAAGFVSGSVAIIADAWHTLSDSFTSVVVIAGAQYARKPPDRDHPFGHGRAEIIAPVIIGTLLAAVSLNFLIEAFERLVTMHGANFGIFAIVVTAASAAAKEGMAQVSFAAARKSGSKGLKADGWHHRSDAISSLVVLAGVIAGRHIPWIDGALGIIIAMLIGYTAYEIIKDGINPLLGEKPPDQLVNKIKKIAGDTTPEAVNMHHFHLHTYGEHKELTFHITIDGKNSICKGHQIATEIENALEEQTGIVATIHIEPHEEAPE